MNNLTPELRVDVNGRVVTRHVRAEKKAGKVMTVPAAPQYRSDAHRAVAVAIQNHLKDYPMMRGYSPIRDADIKLTSESIQRYVNSLPDELALTCMNGLFDNESDRGYQLLLISAANSNEPANMLSDIDFLYDPEDEYHVDSSWNESANMAENHLYLRALVKGIRSHSDWGLVLPERFAKASTEDQTKVRALYKFTDQELTWESEESGIDVEWSDAVYFVKISIRDQELFNQIIANPDKVDEIADFIHERGHNYDLLHDYMAEISALRNGTL